MQDSDSRTWTISEAAELVGAPASTLRFYEREQLLPQVHRTAGGIRVFQSEDLAAIRVIQCLKSAGLSLPQIQQFMAWCREGDSTLSRRRDLFESARAAVLDQMAELQRTLETVNFKCWYYGEAAAHGSEAAVVGIPEDGIPESVRQAGKNLHAV